MSVVAHDCLSSHWTHRKVYTLMFAIYHRTDENCPLPMVIGNNEEKIPPQNFDEQFSSVEKHSWLLLGLKQRGFGKGRWNGFGGKLQSGDASPKAAALREMEEESGIKLKDSEVEEVGRIWFTFDNQSECMEVHVFCCRNWKPTIGESNNLEWPSYSEEMHAAWFPIGFINTDKSNLDTSHIPFNHMWPDDLIWLPHLLQGQLFLGWLHFIPTSNIHMNENSSKLTDCYLETNGIPIEPYEIPAYHLELYLKSTISNVIMNANYCTNTDNESCNKDSNSLLSIIVEHLNLYTDDSIKLWMKAENTQSIIPYKTLDFP